MKIYVASKWERFQDVRVIMQRLVEDGHTITCDWTRAGGPQGLKNGELHLHLVEAAQLDLRGVEDCDCLVLLHDDRAQGGLIEFGAALVQKKLIAILRGRCQRSPVFYSHPLVNHFDGLIELVEWLHWMETKFVDEPKVA